MEGDGLRVLRLVLALCAIGTLIGSPRAISQTPRDAAVAQVRTSLARRELWGRDYPLLIASIPGWARIREKTVIVAADVVIGGTPFATPEEAEKRARALREALAAAPDALRSDFARIAGQAVEAAAAKVGVHRYGADNSYRVIVGLGIDLLPPSLRLAKVERVHGKRRTVEREVVDGGEYRPIVLTGYVYAGGALVYQTSNYAPIPGQVVRVVLSVPAAFQALVEKR